jgi:hypothetical protein
MLFGLWTAQYAAGILLRGGSFLLILGALLFLFRIIQREDVRWLKDLVYKK